MVWDAQLGLSSPGGWWHSWLLHGLNLAYCLLSTLTVEYTVFSTITNFFNNGLLTYRVTDSGGGGGGGGRGLKHPAGCFASACTCVVAAAVE